MASKEQETRGGYMIQFVGSGTTAGDGPEAMKEVEDRPVEDSDSDEGDEREKTWSYPPPPIGNGETAAKLRLVQRR